MGRGTTWYLQTGSATIHIPNCNWARFSVPGPYPTSSSSTNQCGCSWSSKLHPVSCSPSGPMAPNGKCRRYPDAATFRITREYVLQGAASGLNQSRQPHTFGNHPAPLWWSWYHLTHGHRGEWAENEKIIFAPRPNGGTIWTDWRRSGVCRSR